MRLIRTIVGNSRYYKYNDIDHNPHRLAYTQKEYAHFSLHGKHQNIVGPARLWKRYKSDDVYQIEYHINGNYIDIYKLDGTNWVKYHDN